MRVLIMFMLAIALPMQIVANSDTTFDQQIKIELKDAIYESGYRQPDAVANFANDWLKNRDISYTARAEISPYAPKGGVSRRTLRVYLGDARGDNWWGVLFPTLIERPQGSVIASWMRRVKERMQNV